MIFVNILSTASCEDKKDINFFDLKLDKLSELITKSTKDAIVTCLAVEVGLGGVYGEEVCLLSGINKNKKEDSHEKKNSLNSPHWLKRIKYSSFGIWPNRKL